MIVDIFALSIVFGNHIDIAIIVLAIPMRRERIIESGVYGDIILPLFWNVERVNYIYVFIKFAIDKPSTLHKLAIPSAFKFIL